MNTVYYRLYISANKISVIEMQDHDELDYDRDRFLKNPESEEPLYFMSENSAIKYLHANIDPQYIPEKYLRTDQSRYFKK